MESIIRRRKEERLKAIKLAKNFLECAKNHLVLRKAYIVGSYTRGDFNMWSDIDLVLIAENIPRSPIERLDLVKECLQAYPDVEPIIISPRIFAKLKEKRNPLSIEIEKHGIEIL